MNEDEWERNIRSYFIKIFKDLYIYNTYLERQGNGKMIQYDTEVSFNEELCCLKLIIK